MRNDLPVTGLVPIQWLQCTMEKVRVNGVYLLENGLQPLLFAGIAAHPTWIQVLVTPRFTSLSSGKKFSEYWKSRFNSFLFQFWLYGGQQSAGRQHEGEAAVEGPRQAARPQHQVLFHQASRPAGHNPQSPLLAYAAEEL